MLTWIIREIFVLKLPQCWSLHNLKLNVKMSYILYTILDYRLDNSIFFLLRYFCEIPFLFILLKVLWEKRGCVQLSIFLAFIWIRCSVFHPFLFFIFYFLFNKDNLLNKKVKKKGWGDVKPNPSKEKQKW